MQRQPARALAVSFVAVGASIALCGPAPLAVHRPSQDRGAPTLFTIEKTYGTLEFRGTVERREDGDDYEFRARISTTFHPGAAVNRTAVANLRICQLVVTRLARAGQPAEMIHRDVRSIEVLLSNEGDTGALPELVFRVPRSLADAADHVGLGVSDGKLLWPVGVTLK